MGASRHAWSSQLLLVIMRARIERKRKVPATKLDAEVAASLGLLDVVEGLAEGESLIDVLIDALHEIGKSSIVKKLKVLKGMLANAQKTVRSNAVKTSRMTNLAYVH
jgi:urease gamma subunit